MSKKLEVGDRLLSKSYGYFIVEKIVSSNEVFVRFENTGGISKAAAGNVRNGLVRDNFARTVYGVGYFGDGNFRARHPNNGPCTKEYGTWSSMLFRCYSKDRDASTLRNYGDCTVCDEWHNFQNFAKWCQTQPEMLYPDSSLDKDIRVKGNRVYSPETCCFVPQYINTAITGIKHQNSTGKAGVWKYKESYVSEITVFSTKAALGSFDNKEDAEYMYRQVKQTYIRALAEVFKSRISTEVYEKLKGWCCDEITI
jgi:hypothetical protein